METYERKNRLAEALAIRGLKQVELVEKTGLSKSAINNWVKNRWQPKQTPLLKMARALDVSEMWLAGYDVPIERPVSQKRNDILNDTLSLLRNNERYFNLVDMIVNLDDEQLILIENMVKQLKKD